MESVGNQPFELPASESCFLGPAKRLLNFGIQKCGDGEVGMTTAVNKNC